jgi:hypothetical protein
MLPTLHRLETRPAAHAPPPIMPRSQARASVFPSCCPSLDSCPSFRPPNRCGYAVRRLHLMLNHALVLPPTTRRALGGPPPLMCASSRITLLLDNLGHLRQGRQPLPYSHGRVLRRMELCGMQANKAAMLDAKACVRYSGGRLDHLLAGWLHLFPLVIGGREGGAAVGGPLQSRRRSWSRERRPTNQCWHFNSWNI